jgi:serine/threonine protein kinase
VGRHELLKAAWVDEDGDEEEKQWCVLKGFGHGDEKRLRRELGVLARLRHPNIIPLQAVCKRNDRYYVQLPLHPHSLKEALTGPGPGPAHEAESKEDRLLRLVGMLRGLLEGLHFLHQVRELFVYFLHTVSCFVLFVSALLL